MAKDRIVIIDGNSLVNRAFYALPPFVTKDGQHTNAIYGFLTMLLKVLEDYKPQYIGVAFDLKAPTFRHKEFTDYKAGRKKMPNELREQIEPLKELLDALNIFRIELEGYEADDLIGTLSKYCENKEMECLIVTGDKDALQLVSQDVKVLITRKGISSLDIYDDKKLMEDYEVTPLQFIDLKALMGDKSDNIPGVPGVGEKTAIKLVKQFESVENLIQNTHEIAAAKLREKVENHIQDIILSKRLATIITDIPVEFDIKTLEAEEPNYEDLIGLLKRFEFNSLISRFSKVESSSNQLTTIATENLKVIDSLEDVKILADKMKETGEVVIKTIVGGGENIITNKIIALGMAVTSEDIYYIDFKGLKDQEKALALLKEVLEDENTKIIGHDIKKELVHFAPHQIHINHVAFDTFIGEYLIDPAKSTYNLKELAAIYLGEDIKDEEELLGKGKGRKTFTDLTEEELQNFLYQQVKVIYNLVPKIKERLTELSLEKLYYEVELPLTEVLASMEVAGIKVDKHMLEKLEIQFTDKINQLTTEIYELAGVEFNINSPKQLGEILFDKLELPPLKKTKTGYSTNAEVLEKLQEKHEIIPKILEYRTIAKLKSTYVDGLLSIINPVTKRIHSSFNQTVTTTGRISSTEPNLQNIPVRLELGRQLRKVFISKEGHQFIDADYSQIELRVLAHISKDENLIDAFEKDQDIHTRTASEIFGVPVEEVTSAMRSSAKAVNFGIVYGISDFGLGENLKISRVEAKKYIDKYLEKYSSVRNYMENIIKEGKEKGYVVTLLNRRRYLPELHSKNFNIRSFGERMAMNTPIQGSAADIIKIAMINVYRKLKEEGLNGRLILQVHDELIVETPHEEMEQVTEIIKVGMESAMDLAVKLKIDVSYGSNWYDAK
ncbi:DNA polymerase I [Alkaliphilus transvaalensis]|uniref:DNA polymerase I n=1 Tax=Alkaliphilus transvaalensis TaxID=114628 RepID=UPI00047AAC54|nr:DNA polymerase I [Alkaliphilus transvaalensis]